MILRADLKVRYLPDVEAEVVILEHGLRSGEIRNNRVQQRGHPLLFGGCGDLIYVVDTPTFFGRTVEESKIHLFLIRVHI